MLDTIIVDGIAQEKLAKVTGLCVTREAEYPAVNSLKVPTSIFCGFTPRCNSCLQLLMEDFAELMQRLLELQCGGRERSPELIAEDERLMDGLRRELCARKTPPANAEN